MQNTHGGAAMKVKIEGSETGVLSQNFFHPILAIKVSQDMRATLATRYRGNESPSATRQSKPPSILCALWASQ